VAATLLWVAPAPALAAAALAAAAPIAAAPTAAAPTAAAPTASAPLGAAAAGGKDAVAGGADAASLPHVSECGRCHECLTSAAAVAAAARDGAGVRLHAAPAYQSVRAWMRDNVGGGRAEGAAGARSAALSLLPPLPAGAAAGGGGGEGGGAAAAPAPPPRYADCVRCQGCAHELRAMPRTSTFATAGLNATFTSESGASPAWMFLIPGSAVDGRAAAAAAAAATAAAAAAPAGGVDGADDYGGPPEGGPPPAVDAAVKVFCLPARKPGQRPDERLPECNRGRVQQQARILMAQQAVADACGLSDVTPRSWIAPVNGVEPSACPRRAPPAFGSGRRARRPPA